MHRGTSPLAVGLAGAGMISRHHLIAWSKVDGARVAAICDPDLDRARERADEFGIDAVYADARTMIEREDLGALDVATPRETHAAVVRLAAARGLPVLCQKPLCPTLAEATALVDAIAGRARLMVHENWRFRPWYRYAQRTLAARQLGEIRQARMSVLNTSLVADANGRYPAIERQPFFRSESRLLVAEVLIHHLDVLRWLLGPLRVVAARTAHDVPAVAGETLASVYLETARRAPVVLEANMAAHGHPARGTDRLMIAGTTGTLDLRGDTLRLSGAKNSVQIFDLDVGYQASFDGALAHFVDRLRDGAEFETAPADNLQTLALVEAIYAAAAR